MKELKCMNNKLKLPGLAMLCYPFFVVAAPIEVSVGLQTETTTAEEAVEQQLPTVLTALQEDATKLEEGSQAFVNNQQLQQSLVNIQSATPEEREIALKVISPKVNSASTTAVQKTPTNVNLQNIGPRLSVLRAAANTKSFSRFQNNETPNVKIDLLDLASTLSGIKKASDAEGGLLDNRLNFFVTSDIILSEQTETNNTTGFDSNGQRVLAGIDYRHKRNIFLGITSNYARNKLDLSAKAGELSTNSYGVSGYASINISDSFYVQTSINTAKQNFDMKRNINFTTTVNGTATPTSTTASSNPGGKSFGISLSGGYDDFIANFLNIGLYSSLDYSKSTIDGFVEGGQAGGFSLTVAEQNIKSLQFSAGGQLSFSWSQSWGIVLPYLRASFIHEFEQDNKEISAYFTADPTKSPLNFMTSGQDSNTASAALGSTFIFPRGFMVFAQYSRQFFVDNYSQQVITLGVRKEL